MLVGEFEITSTHLLIAAIAAYNVYSRIDARNSVNALAQADLKEIELTQTKGVPIGRIEQGRNSLELIGFRRFVDFHKLGLNSLMRRNFTSSMLSNDRTIVGSVEHCHCYSIPMLIASAVTKDNLCRKTGIVFASYFEDGTRMITSALLKEAPWPPTTVQVAVPQGLALPQIYELHRSAAVNLATSRKTKAVELRDKSQLLALVNQHSAKTAESIKAL